MLDEEIRMISNPAQFRNAISNVKTCSVAENSPWIKLISKNREVHFDAVQKKK